MLAEQFLAEQVKTPAREPRYNVAPTDEVYAVATIGGTRRLGALSWGLVPSWSKSASGTRMVNLRAETVSERPGFRRTLQKRRCIIPADGFYEWKEMGRDRPKQPFLVRHRGAGPLALAGLWEVWRDRDDQDADWLRTCTIITTEPNDLVAPLHDRMPVILPPEAWDTWLDPEVTGVDVLGSLLRPFPSELLAAWPVGTEVNSVRNDGPGLVEPLEGHQPG